MPCFGSTTVQAPVTPDPAQTYSNVLQSQIALAPQQFAAESQYAPQYAQLYSNILQQQLPQLLQTYSQQAPAIGDLQAQLNRYQRQADITDVSSLGQQAVQAFQQANPQLMQLQQAATDRALANGQPIQGLGAAPQFSQQGLPNQIQAQQLGAGPQLSAGQNPLLNQMQAGAANQLAAGGQLSQQDVSGIANQVASQYNLMGRAQDPITAATTALNLDSAQRARLQEAQQYAGNVAGMQTQQQGLGLQAQQGTGQLGLGYGSADQQAAMQAAQANLQAQQANQQLNLQAQQLGGQYGLGYGQANQQAQYQNAMLGQQQLMGAGGLLAQTSQDPYAMILGRSGGIGQLGGLGQQAGGFGTTSTGFNYVQPGTSMYGDYTNQTAAANQSNAKINAGMFAGAMNILGGSGGFNMGCWVAREVYGQDNPKWIMFRHWMLNVGPKWFRNLYLKHGEKFAAFIKNKPVLKSIIRNWMDARVNGLVKGEKIYA